MLSLHQIIAIAFSTPEVAWTDYKQSVFPSLIMNLFRPDHELWLAIKLTGNDRITSGTRQTAYLQSAH